MKKIICFLLLLSLIWGHRVLSEIEPQNDDLTRTINYLLSFVENSGCLFIRNDKEYSAKEAADHIRRKYEHFRDKIKTPEDFIRLTATKSLMTYQPYYVKLKDGEIVKSANWLLKALEAYRNTLQ